MFLFCCFPVPPKGFYGFASLLFVTNKFKSHLFPIASKGGSFFIVQVVELEHCPIARRQFPLYSRVRQFVPVSISS